MAKTDKKTLELIALVDQQKKEIAKLEKPSYKTNCTFSYHEGNKSYATNLHVETDVKKLINIAAFLSTQEENYQKAAKLLQVETVPPFTWDGYTVQEWLGDLKLRINKVQINAKKKKLELMEERLNKVISPELRAEMELEAISKELNQ